MSGVIRTFVQQKYPLGIPYDTFNAAVTDDLKNQMCSICRIYFGKIKMMKMHCQSCKTHFYNNTLDVEENIAERVR